MNDEQFKRILFRERNSRKESEELLEVKSLELWELNQSLELKVKERTEELEKTLVDLKASSQAKSDFLSNMSHEIRTPINAILGFLEVMSNSIYEKEHFDRYLAIMSSSGKNLLQIINDILDISKIQSGKFTISIISVDMKTKLEHLISLFGNNAAEENITLEVKFSDDFPSFLLVDDTRVLQIVSNFISNAIKFTEQNGKVNVKVDYSIDTNNLLIEVVDNGIGIEESAQESIFKAFEQEDSGTTRNYGGTGLGLFISVALISLMNGKIIFRSKKGEGSCFGFNIPVRTSHEAENQGEQSIKPKEEYQKRMLIVEDNKTNIMLLEIILEDINVEYDVVFNGVEAINAVIEGDYGLVLMDNQMPIMGGTEATKNIREFNKEIAIVALSANVMQDEQAEFIQSGMNSTLAKPIDVDKLIQVLNEYL